MHKTNPDVIDMAKNIGRTPSAVAMKMVNFASLDPSNQRRNVKGLQHIRRLDEQIWEEFHEDSDRLALESQRSLAKVLGKDSKEYELDVALMEPDIPTEARGTKKVRLVQQFFRDAVLSSYNYSCAVCSIALRSMLNASHIIPWSIDEKRRADPSNGLSLCAFHDRAFDRGLITIDEYLRVVLSPSARVEDSSKLHQVGLLEVEGQVLSKPEKFSPDEIALSYHRENVFLG
jgi:predicted restriction endonuclease